MAAQPLPPPAETVLEMIGRTPMLRVTRLDTGPCQLFLKLENQNPGGSIKDRIGRAMIEEAEASGRIRPGGTLIEATAGNTGLGLALVAAQKGYRLIIVMPDKMSREKIYHLRALGAEVVMTRSDVGKGHPEYYQDMAEAMAARLDNAFYVNQFANPANPLAHETTTGPEIWEQMEGRLDAVVCGVGSGGTLTGLGRYFSRVAPQVRVVLADPAGSILAEKLKSGRMTEAGSWLVEGIGEDFIPPNLELGLASAAYTVSDADSFAAARELLHREGILAGSSTGTLLAAALRYCREQTSPQRVVSFVCDSGNKYLSKMYNDHWMLDQGFIARDRHGDLRDLVARRPSERAVVTVAADDTLNAAYGRMKLNDVSQLPVMEGETIVGLIDESDLLLAIHQDPARFADPVGTAMTSRLQTVAPDAPLDTLLPIFDAGRVAILVEDGRFLGLITPIDLLNHLRQKVA